MTSTIKVNTVKDTASTDIIKKCGTSITVGTASDTTTVAGNAVRSNAIQASDGQNIISQVGATITLGATGDNIVLAGGATQSGFGRTGTVDWQTGSIKTATFTAANGEGYFCNTAGGTFEVDLPAGVVGAIVSIQDYNNTFDTNALTVDPNGSEKINGGDAGDIVTLNTEGRGVTFVYVDATVGWRSVQDNDFSKIGQVPSFVAATGGTVTTCGDFKIHTFTGPGNFCVSAAGNTSGSNGVEYIVTAGAGSGGRGDGNHGGGGGGAGGFRFASSSLAPESYPGKPLAAPANLQVTVTNFPITVGAGGAGATGDPGSNSGSNSIFSTLTAAGGGGAGKGISSSSYPGLNGGSGGGAGVDGFTTCRSGSGNTPPVSPPQGKDGAVSAPNPSGGYAGAGGGGGAVCTGNAIAGGPGSATGGPGGDGAGIPTAFGSNGVPCGASRFYAGGGGGASRSCVPSAAAGGKGGGGASAPGSGVAGTTNSGGGGGGALSTSAGGSGGSGIVIIRYKFQ